MPTENCSYSFWVGHFFFRRLFWLSCTFSIVTHLNRMYTKCDSIGGPISKFTIPTVSTIQCVIVCTNTFDGQPNHWTVSGFCFRKINHFFNNWTMKCLFPCTTISLKCRWFFFLASFLSFPLSIYHFSFLQPFLAPVYTLSLSLFQFTFYHFKWTWSLLFRNACKGQEYYYIDLGLSQLDSHTNVWLQISFSLFEQSTIQLTGLVYYINSTIMVVFVFEWNTHTPRSNECFKFSFN